MCNTKQTDVDLPEKRTDVGLSEKQIVIMSRVKYDKENEKFIDMNINFNNHEHVNSDMFAILLNWITEVNDKFKTSSETLFLTHQVISRYLVITRNIARSKLQLLGITAYFMCSKFEDDYYPEICDMVRICAKTYTADEIIKMESDILHSFDFKLLFTTTMFDFVISFSFFAHLDPIMELCVRYLCELSLTKTSFLKFKLSKIVCSAIAIVRHMYKRKIWKTSLVMHTGYELTDLYDCMNDFKNIFNDTNFIEKQYVKKKYSQKKYHEISRCFDLYQWDYLNEI